MIFLIYIFFIVMAQAQLYLFKNKILEVNSKYINKHDPAKKKKPFKKVIKSLEEGNTNMDDFITQDEIQKQTLILRGFTKGVPIEKMHNYLNSVTNKFKIYVYNKRFEKLKHDE